MKKIRFTPNAFDQLTLFSNIKTNETGFLSGTEIGKFIIIENLIPVNFSEKTINTVYAEIYSRMGDKLKGVFFINREPFVHEWFLEDIIMKVVSSEPEFFVILADLNPSGSDETGTGRNCLTLTPLETDGYNLILESK